MRVTTKFQDFKKIINFYRRDYLQFTKYKQDESKLVVD